MQELNLKVELYPSEELKTFLASILSSAKGEVSPVVVEQEAMPTSQEIKPVVEAPKESIAPAPVSEREYTLDEISLAATSLMAMGNQEVLALLPKFNITQLSTLPTEKYSEFALELRKLGAKI